MLKGKYARYIYNIHVHKHNISIFFLTYIEIKFNLRYQSEHKSKVPISLF